MIYRDDHRRTDCDHPPQAQGECAHPCPRTRETGTQAVALKPHVGVLVVDDPRGDGARHRIRTRRSQAPVIGQGDDLGDGQHHQLGAQAQQTA